MNLSSIELDAARASVNYAKARLAIEADIEDFPNRQKRRDAKMTIISHLNGTKEGNVVTFGDGSKAVF